ncbi:MAG: dTDP-glucose 4,6-dehydratase [Candidatus Omnitrophota bacterium]|nr:MAG: dTDP-glucose 4,6-dehydratase [Candidatus Omnitrophota bacterium]
MQKRILVTGGAGFIGSEFVREGVRRGYSLIVVDKLTYAGDIERLKEVSGRYRFYKVDICYKRKIKEIFKQEKPQVVVHFAAQTHVDRSICNAQPFVNTNIQGTQVLLDVAKECAIERFVHISSDEVYGEIKEGRFSEDSPLAPNNPYSATKASADLFIKAYIRTYNFPAIIVRASNNYGPWQHPEKFIPVLIYNALKGRRVPVYGEGINRREWLYVSDCVRAIYLIMEKGILGEIYNISSGIEKSNIELAHFVLQILGKGRSLIQFVKDRPGHDIRYALDWSKISKLGWKPEMDFERGLNKTVKWYKDHIDWLQSRIASSKRAR